jgi:ankyrin repeat protein
MVALKKKLSELSDDEKELFVALQDGVYNMCLTPMVVCFSGNEPRIRELLADTAVRTDCTDASGMTPLSHACFKSNVSMVRLLIARSADVNTLEHSEGYTPLMFAALAGECAHTRASTYTHTGSTDICKILLEAGAKTYRTNRINKTASEMAAFTGQHACVALINNYLSLDNIEAILSPKGARVRSLSTHHSSR